MTLEQLVTTGHVIFLMDVPILELVTLIPPPRVTMDHASSAVLDVLIPALQTTIQLQP
jgi:hypothetical protein